MFEFGGYTVSMKNARQIQSITDDTTQYTNEEDGALYI